MTGDELSQAIATPPASAPPLVESFLHSHCAVMLTGETGKGKSVIAANLALALTSQTPLFGTLTIPTPRRVYYLQMEGSAQEQYRRLHFMSQVIPVNTHRLAWDADRRTRLMALNALSVAKKLDQIGKTFSEPPDLVVIDPIYKAVGGDIAKAEPALALVDFSDRLMETFGCSVLLVHHPHREKLTVYGKKVEEDDWYYGHSFLKNHIEVSYAFHSTHLEGQTGRLLLKKRREENVLEQLDLVYHPETYTCSMLAQPSPDGKREAVEAFLRQVALNGGVTDFYEVKRLTGVRTSFLRELQAGYVAEGSLVITRTSGKKSLWKPLLGVS